MSAIDLRRRFTACGDPLGTHHEDRNDHIDKDHEYDGPKICHRTAAEQRLARRDIGTSSGRQKRDQASGNRPGV